MTTPSGQRPPRIVVVGGGFAGFYALRRLQRQLSPEQAELVLVNPTDYLLYSPLLPEVATGVIEARHIAVSLRRALPRVRLVLGHATAVDFDERTVTVVSVPASGPAEVSQEPFDRLVLVPGSVTRQFDIPGVAEHARGLKTLVEAVYLRDHLLHQLDAADAEPDTDEGRARRRERLTVVAVGAGYTGTEFVAQTQRWLRRIERRWSRTGAEDIRWVLVDLAEAVLPELGPELGELALDLLRDRGVDVRLGVTVASAEDRTVRLTDGSVIATRTLVWGAGVTASPLIGGLGLPTRKGRLVVDADLSVPGVRDVWAAGDAAAVPDLATALPAATPPPTPPTAQHAQRQGTALGRNVAASLGVGTARPYRHRDLGLVADLGGRDAVAKPLGLPLTGPLAKFVTRGYHLYALPAMANRLRVATDWLWQAVLPPESTQLDVIRPEDARLAAAQGTGLYGQQLQGRGTGSDAGRPARVVIAPDSFKGTLGAAAAADALAAGWRAERPDDELLTLPLADGGEGTLEALGHDLPAECWRSVRVAGPDGRPVDAAWLLLPDGTAVVEMARAAGLPLLEHPDPLGASTRGLGELLAAVVADPGVTGVMLTLGGSATTDGGTGALAALGARFLDADGAELPPGGAALARLDRVDLTGLTPPPPGGVRCLVDVTAPLLGPLGAAGQFGPQKGASAEQVAELDAALARLADVLGGDREAPGSGAAGGTAYGFAVCWGARFVSGADAVAAAAGLDDALDGAALAVTGEGQFDAQSLRGKVVGDLIARADRAGVPVAVVAGRVDTGAEDAVHRAVALTDLAGSVAAAMADPARWLAEAGRRLAREQSVPR